MSINVGDAILRLFADDSGLDKGLASAETKAKGWVSSLGGTMTKLLGGAVVAGVTAAASAVVGIGVAAFKAGETVDGAFDTISLATGATGAELTQLQKDFKTVFTSVPTEAGPAADVIGSLNSRLGITGDALTDMANPLLEVSRLMGGDAKTNAELLTRVMGDWGVSAEDGSTTLDKLFTASQNTGAGLEDLMRNVVEFGSPMRLMGFSLEDSIALFSKWEAEGVNSELVMGSLRIAAGNFAREGKPLQESLQNTFDSIKNNEDASEALADAMEVFGARAGPDMAAAIREGRFEIDDLVTAMGDSEGAVMDAAAAAEDWGEKWTKLKNKATTALAPVGLKLMDLASVVLDRLTPAFDSLVAFVETNLGPAFDQGMGIFGQLGAWLGQHIPGAIQVLSDIWNNVLMPVWQGYVDYWTAFVLPILTGIIDFFQVTIPAAITFWKGIWDENVKPALEEVWVAAEENLIPILQNIYNWFQEFLPVAIGTLLTFWEENLMPALMNFWTWVAENLIPILADVAVWLLENLPVAIQKVSDFWNGVLKPALETAWSYFNENIIPILQTVWTWLQENVPAALQTLSDFWNNTLLPALTAAWDYFNANILPILQSVYDIITLSLNIAIEALAGLWENVLLPALTGIWTYLNDNIMPIFTTLKNFISDELGPKVLWLKDEVFQPLAETLKNGVNAGLGWVKEKLAWLKSFLEDFELPDFLQRHSPSPFEMTFIGAADAIHQLAKQELPNLKASLEMALPGLAGSPQTAKEKTTIHNWNLNARYGYESEMTLTRFVRLQQMLSS